MSGLETNVPGPVPKRRDAVATQQLLPTLSLTLWSCRLRLVFPADPPSRFLFAYGWSESSPEHCNCWTAWEIECVARHIADPRKVGGLSEK